jgi:drug/metabolite transporter (DMT)-like permease
VAWVLLAAVLWSGVGPLSRLALGAGLAPLDVALARAAGAGACFVLLLAVRGGDLPRARDLPALLGFALVGVALLFALNQLAVRAGGAALATILLYSAPIWVTAAAPLLGERWRRRSVFAALAAAAGIALVALGGDGALHPTPAALLWGLASGLAYALHSVLGKRLLRHASPEGLFALALPVAALALAGAGARVAAPSAAQLAPVAALGVVSFLASLAYGHGLRAVPAARAALLATVEPVGAALLAHALFGERFGLIAGAGACLTLAGAAVGR